MHRRILMNVVFCAVFTSPLFAQSNPASVPVAPGYAPPAQSAGAGSASLTPGSLLLLELEGRFSQAVATGGGKAFASWFADDAVILNNGRPPVVGRAAIDAKTQWDPKAYQLIWIPQTAQMGPSNDMGFTWGHFETHSKGKNGEPIVTSGRYFTVWKKLPDGSWKVALDASADEPTTTTQLKP